MVNVMNNAKMNEILINFKKLLCKPIDNQFTLENYSKGNFFINGDIISYKSIFGEKQKNIIVNLYTDELNRSKLHAVKIEKNGKRKNICAHRLALDSRQKNYEAHWKKIYGIDDAQESVEKFLEQGSLETAFCETMGLFRANINIDNILQRIVDKSDSLLEKNGDLEIDFTTGSNLIKILKCKFYSELLLSNKLDKGILIKAANLSEKIYGNLSPYQRGVFDIQDYYLAGARMAIIANDIELAREILSTKRSFKGQPDQYKLLKKLTRKSIKPDTGAELRSQCLALVDFLRRPDSMYYFAGTYPEMDWATIVEIHFTKNEVIDWKKVYRNLLR